MDKPASKRSEVLMNMDPSWTLPIVNIIIGTIIVGPILWLIGRALVGPDKAKLTDALWIMLLGQIIGAIVGFVTGFDFTLSIIGFIIQLVIWLALIRHFFDTGWGKALVIAIIAVIVSAIIFAILAIVLAVLGFITAIL